MEWLENKDLHTRALVVSSARDGMPVGEALWAALKELREEWKSPEISGLPDQHVHLQAPVPAGNSSRGRTRSRSSSPQRPAGQTSKGQSKAAKGQSWKGGDILNIA